MFVSSDGVIDATALGRGAAVLMVGIVLIGALSLILKARHERIKERQSNAIDYIVAEAESAIYCLFLCGKAYANDGDAAYHTWKAQYLSDVRELDWRLWLSATANGLLPLMGDADYPVDRESTNDIQAQLYQAGLLAKPTFV